MSFYKKYELLELVRDDGIKTFAAREIRTGMPVQVHLFTGVSPAESDLLWSQLDAIPLERRRGLFAYAEYEGTRYVVTEPLTSPENLRTWVGARTTPAPAPPPATEDVLVKAGSWKIPSALLEKKPPEPEGQPAPTERMNIEEPPAAAPPPEPEPGEFTRMFRSPPEPERPAAPTERMNVTEPPAAAPPPEPEPGEFTRMFQSPPEPPVSQPAKPAPPPEPGEFTRMFAPQPLPKPEPQKPPPAQVQIRKLSPEEQGLAPEGKPRPVFLTPERPASAKPEPAPPAQSEPDEFTQMFQAPESPQEEPGDFTRMFSAPPAEPEPQPSPEESGPGEFTRMFQSPPQPEKPRQPPPPPGEPGEFTRFFENAPRQAPWPSSASQGTPPPPSHPGPLDQPGEFTRMFGGDVTLKQPAPREPAPPYGGATQSFSPPSGPHPPSVPSTGSRGAPGEYTRMIERPREFSAEPQPPQPFNLGEQRAGAAQKPSYLPLILIFGVLFLLAVAVVLFFVLRKP
ncbi:MAG TPA: hypothetical protein VFQ79_04330 [Bryobacteraceae bacterium]|nr:hypothetical protein [Bryobacteraceae bacterium]